MTKHEVNRFTYSYS